ncbi:gamma-glutamyl-gamma-aminobutyrate hydrolase family protein [Luteococcus peritonei]|uniref:Gamma-glutamyl-gamma-aminobutyrate hydrolase family protein n=1 Tax=Luteococcus peritonei TaxID=88874 RepID=A0ABW4RZS0_9ACTN
MSTRPVIGIITNLELDPHYLFPGYARVTVNEDYHRSLLAAGAVPVLIPPTPELSVLPDQLALLDGLVLAGGQDVDPLRYGAQPRLECGVPNPRRDAFELEALRLAREAGLPTFGICRGLQIVNTFLGGTLHQDISHAGSPQRHMMGGNPALGAHAISIEPDSFLDDAWGTRSAVVNSFHHQAVDRVAEQLAVVARAADGIVEAVEYTGEEFDLFAVQWHPEMMSGSDARAKALFTWFVDLVAGRWES